MYYLVSWSTWFIYICLWQHIKRFFNLKYDRKRERKWEGKRENERKAELKMTECAITENYIQLVAQLSYPQCIAKLCVVLQCRSNINLQLPLTNNWRRLPSERLTEWSTVWGKFSFPCIDSAEPSLHALRGCVFLSPPLFSVFPRSLAPSPLYFEESPYHCVASTLSQNSSHYLLGMPLKYFLIVVFPKPSFSFLSEHSMSSLWSWGDFVVFVFILCSFWWKE